MVLIRATQKIALWGTFRKMLHRSHEKLDLDRKIHTLILFSLLKSIQGRMSCKCFAHLLQMTLHHIQYMQ
jgi:hypothetical protein